MWQYSNGDSVVVFSRSFVMEHGRLCLCAALSHPTLLVLFLCVNICLKSRLEL